MSKFAVKKLRKYIVKRLIENAYNEGLLNKDNFDISDLQLRLKIEVEARLVVIQEGQHTFDDLVSALEKQIKVSELLTITLPI